MNRKPIDNKTLMDKRSRMLHIGRAVRIALLICIVVAAVILVLNLFVVVRTIKVINETDYESANLVASAGLDIGSPLLSVNPKKVKKAILNDYSYVKDVTVNVGFPSEVTVSVVPSVPYMAIETGYGDYFYLDSDMKVLERTRELYDNVIFVVGMTFDVGDDPQENFGVVMGKEFDYDVNIEMSVIEDIFDNLDRYDMRGSLTSVNLSVKYNISFTLENRITVELGTSENTEKKFDLLIRILEKNKNNNKMIINVRDYTKGRCRIISQ